jgi:hypothetical protein
MMNDLHMSLERYLAGQLGEMEFSALEERLLNDADLRKELLILAALEAELPLALKDAAMEHDGAVFQPAIKKAPRSLRTSLPTPMHRNASLRSTQKHPTGWLAIAASLAVVAGSLAISNWRKQAPDVIATILDAGPGVLVAARGQPPGPAMAGMPIHPGDLVTAPSDGAATLQYVVNDRREATIVRLFAGSEVRFWQERGGKRAYLAQGGMACEVAIQEGGKPMIVTTPHAEVEVLGTRFNLTAAEDTHLAVDAGSVRLLELASARKTIVSAGGRAVAKGHETPSYREITETFDTAESTAANGWSGSGNKANGKNFGWLERGIGSGGAAGGTFTRTSSYSHFADLSIGTVSRTSSLRLAGSLELNNRNYDGVFYLGYFKPGDEQNNFLGLMFIEPVGGEDKPFRCYASVVGEHGAGMGIIELPQNTTLSFDLTWSGKPDGSGTLSGTVAGQNVFIPAAAAVENYSAFGLLNGGARSSDVTLKTSNCYFDNLIYTAAAEKNSKR